MKRFFLLLACAVLLFGGTGAFFYGVKLSRFDVDRQNNDLMIAWQASEEVAVVKYELLRRTSASQERFVAISTIAPHGPDKAYRYLDNQVFKNASEEVAYRLEVVYANGLREQLVDKSINYTPTAVRRTWGSIKAMFQ